MTELNIQVYKKGQPGNFLFSNTRPLTELLEKQTNAPKEWPFLPETLAYDALKD